MLSHTASTPTTISITMNMWWGTNGTTYGLYQDGTLIDSKALSANTPQAQTVSSTIAKPARGAHVYTATLTNSHGTTTSKPLTITAR